MIMYHVTHMIPLYMYNGFYLFPLSRAINSNRLIFDPSEVEIHPYLFVYQVGVNNWVWCGIFQRQRAPVLLHVPLPQVISDGFKCTLQCSSTGSVFDRVSTLRVSITVLPLAVKR